MRIWFELRPLADIEPWGPPDRPSLSWFGLTDGHYDLIFDDQHLFSEPGGTGGIDYQVVRLWEDLLDIAAAVLEPVPDAIASRIDDRWLAWAATALDEDALRWWWRRELTSGHLVRAPRVQLWRVGDAIRIRWTVPPPEDGIAWVSQGGETTISAAAFRDELVRFDRALIAGMQSRIEEIERGWDRPIAIDVAQLRQEQVQRATWLERRLRDPGTNWDAVLRALASAS